MASTSGISGGQTPQDILQYQRLMAARQAAPKTSLLDTGNQASPTTNSPFLRDADSQASATQASGGAAALTGGGGMLSGALSGLLLQLQSQGSGDSGSAAPPAPAEARTASDSAGADSDATQTPRKSAQRAPGGGVTLNGANLLVFAQLQGQTA